MPRRRGRGSDQAWNWSEAHATCLRLARRYGSGPDAEDVAQEAVVRAWRFRARLRPETRLDPLLATIVRNEVARQRARPRPEPIADIDVFEGAEDEGMAAVLTRAELAGALAQLEPSERLLLKLRYDRDLTQPAIARTLDMPEGTVKVRLHRARAKLHRALDDS